MDLESASFFVPGLLDKKWEYQSNQPKLKRRENDMSENEVKEEVAEEAVVESVESVEKPNLWNPNAAANWSILFTPIFGAWLHSKNWKELGDEGKAKKSMYWAYAGFLVLFLSLFISKLSFVFLLAWYFAAARKQVKYIKKELGDEYERKAWKKPLKIGAVWLISMMIFLGISSACSGGGEVGKSGFSKNMLVVKGLCLGQPFDEATVLVKKSIKEIYGYLPDDITYHEEFVDSWMSVGRHGSPVIFSDDSRSEVVKIVFPDVDTLFNVSDLSAEDFVQEFINNYSIPEMETFVESDQYGWKYNDGNGTEVKIYNPSKRVVISKVPSVADRSFN